MDSKTEVINKTVEKSKGDLNEQKKNSHNDESEITKEMEETEKGKESPIRIEQNLKKEKIIQINNINMNVQNPREEDQKIEKKHQKTQLLPKQNEINMKIYPNNKRKEYLKKIYRENLIIIKRQIELKKKEMAFENKQKANDIYLKEKEKEMEIRLKKENEKFLEKKEKEMAARMEKEIAARVEKEIAARVEKEIAARLEKENAARVENEITAGIAKENEKYSSEKEKELYQKENGVEGKGSDSETKEKLNQDN